MTARIGLDERRVAKGMSSTVGNGTDLYTKTHPSVIPPLTLHLNQTEFWIRFD